MAVELKDLTKRSENYSQWYNELVVKADLAEQSAVRGCMVIKPCLLYTSGHKIPYAMPCPWFEEKSRKAENRS